MDMGEGATCGGEGATSGGENTMGMGGVDLRDHMPVYLQT